MEPCLKENKNVLAAKKLHSFFSEIERWKIFTRRSCCS